jgi:hypothetical protein
MVCPIDSTILVNDVERRPHGFGLVNGCVCGHFVIDGH